MEPILPEPKPIEGAQQRSDQLMQPDQLTPQQKTEGRESQLSNPETMQQMPAMQPIQQTQVPQSQQQPTAVQADPPAAQSDDPLIADDVDVIEKEWVDKAKQIVHQTKEDPYLQEKEVSKLQADYLAKRYNKSIKQAE